MVDLLVLETSAVRRVGSSPTFRTKYEVTRYALVVEWYTRWSKKPVPKGLWVRVSPNAPDYTCVYPRMVELVDTGDLKSPAERRAGSSPAPGTRFNSISKVRILFSCLHGVVKW